jgi:tyrosinase
MEWPDDDWLQGVKNPWFTGTEEVDKYGTWTTPAGTYETTTSPLTPFHRDTKGTVYDSDGCRYIKDFGYSFEELQDWKSEFMLPDGRFNTPLYCRTIREKLKEYGWAQHSHRTVCALARGIPIAQVPHDITLGDLLKEERQFDEYFVNVRVDR